MPGFKVKGIERFAFEVAVHHSIKPSGVWILWSFLYREHPAQVLYVPFRENKANRIHRREVPMHFFLGLDPGGEGKFGWCLCVCSKITPIEVHHKGTANHAADAVTKVLNAIGHSDDIIGAGIDAPMFWTKTGSRVVDKIVRQEIIKAGARNASGTVQHINSLRGACLVQGMLAGILLREKFPGLRMTESHPKAVMWLLELITKDKNARPSDEALYANYIVKRGHDLNEHERDAAIGALSAWAMIHEDSAWRNLYPLENDTIDIIPGQMAYWMPKSIK